MQHLCFCEEVQRDEPAQRCRVDQARPGTNVRPDFMVITLRPDDYEDTFRAGPLESRPTFDS